MTAQVLDEVVAHHPFFPRSTGVERTGEPAWLAAHRDGAASWLSGHRLPTRKDEDWRYVDLEPVVSRSFTPPAAIPHEAGAGDLDPLIGATLGGPRLVLVNGFFSPRLSAISSQVARGLRITPLATEIRNGASALVRRWGSPGADYAHAFEALNVALAVDGAYIELAPDTAFEAPIEIVYLTLARGDLPLVSPRSVIWARGGSRATIVETYLGVGEGHSLTNSHTRVLVAPGAHIEHYRFQREGPEAFHLSHVDVHAGAASRFASRTLAVGALLARHEVRARLAHPSAEVQLDGLFLPAGRQCHDNPVLVDHAAPGCTSRQLYKGIISNAGHGVFNGHVIVRSTATGTTTDQVNKNLLLSDRAEIDTRPRLEIFTDEVAATHGAAVGQLDAEALFYLRSRGIPDRAARAMLVSGFAADVLERFTPEPVRRRADELLADHLETMATGSEAEEDER